MDPFFNLVEPFANMKPLNMTSGDAKIFNQGGLGNLYGVLYKLYISSNYYYKNSGQVKVQFGCFFHPICTKNSQKTRLSKIDYGISIVET